MNITLTERFIIITVYVIAKYSKKAVKCSKTFKNNIFFKTFKNG